jgi:hypothetical protein
MVLIAAVLAHGGGLYAFDEVIITVLFGALGIGGALVLKAANETPPKDEDLDDNEDEPDVPEVPRIRFPR